MSALQIAFGFFAALVTSMAAIPLVLKFATAYGLYDRPDVSDGTPLLKNFRRRVHSNPVPRLGGVAIFLGFVLTNFFLSTEPSLRGIILSSCLVFAVGLIDDIVSLSALTRLIVQAGCASFALWSASLKVNVIALSPELYMHVPAWLGYPMAVFIVVGAINAINMIDGLDGLAGGIVMIGISLMSILYFLRTHEVQILLYFTFPIAGAVLGFLRYNTHPASIFMGDCGSNWLGFILGIFFVIVLGDFTIAASGATSTLVPASHVYGATHVPLIALILCLAIPIIDSACVVAMRIRDGLSPMAADNRHFHHTLLKLGFSHKQSVMAVYFLAMLVGIAGVLSVQFPQYGFAWIPYLATLFLLFVIPSSLKANNSLLIRFLEKRVLLRSAKAWNAPLGRFLRYWETCNRYIIYAILIISPTFAGVVRKEIGFMAAAASALLGFSLLGRKRTSDFTDSVMMSLAMVVLLVANNQNNMTLMIFQQRVDVQFLYNALFIALFASTTAMVFCTAKVRYLIFTPSDFLLLTIPLLLLLVPEPFQSTYRFNIICLRSLVIFMALRNMTKRRVYVAYRLRLVCLAALLYVVLTSLAGFRIVY